MGNFDNYNGYSSWQFKYVYDKEEKEKDCWDYKEKEDKCKHHEDKCKHHEEKKKDKCKDYYDKDKDKCKDYYDEDKDDKKDKCKYYYDEDKDNKKDKCKYYYDEDKDDKKDKCKCKHHEEKEDKCKKDDHSYSDNNFYNDWKKEFCKCDDDKLDKQIEKILAALIQELACLEKDVEKINKLLFILGKLICEKKCVSKEILCAFEALKENVKELNRITKETQKSLIVLAKLFC